MCKNAREIQTVDCMVILPIFTLLARICVENNYSRLKFWGIQPFGIPTSVRNSGLFGGKRQGFSKEKLENPGKESGEFYLLQGNTMPLLQNARKGGNYAEKTIRY